MISVVKPWGSQKLQVDFQPQMVAIPNSQVVQGSTVFHTHVFIIGDLLVSFPNFYCFQT